VISCKGLVKAKGIQPEEAKQGESSIFRLEVNRQRSGCNSKIWSLDGSHDLRGAQPLPAREGGLSLLPLHWPILTRNWKLVELSSLSTQWSVLEHSRWERMKNESGGTRGDSPGATRQCPDASSLGNPPLCQ
jgi:hypothetical protein